jgi:hypothetical protein
VTEATFLGRNVTLQILTDGLVVGVGRGQPHPAGDAVDVRVHWKHATATAREQQDAVGSLRADTVHIEQRRPHRIGVARSDELVEARLAAVFRTDTLGEGDDALGLLVVEM